MNFPTIVGTLIAAGFEGYEIDFRQNSAVYFLASGACVRLALPHASGPVSARFDGETIVAAIRAAQTNAPGYSYLGFCSQVTAAGCAGYMVSFLGKRVVYFGRTAEVHVEHFPQ